MKKTESDITFSNIVGRDEISRHENIGCEGCPKGENSIALEQSQRKSVGQTS